MSEAIALGKYLRVTGSFGWGEKQGLVVNEALKSDKRKLNGSVSRIVGFKVYNCSAEVENTLFPVVFKIPIIRWKEVGDGKYEKDPQILELNPGDEAIIENGDFLAYILNHTATHGRTLENGVIKQSSRGGKDMRHLGKLTTFTPEEARYFCFSFSPTPPPGQPKRRLHDPEVKTNVGYKKDGVWKVKDEYKPYFGFLEMSNIYSRRVRKLVQQQVAERIRESYRVASSK